MNKKEYNGWYNYETWNVKLWMDNDEGECNYWDERTTEICERATDKDDAVSNDPELFAELVDA